MIGEFYYNVGEIAEDNMEGLYDNLKSGDSVDIYELLSDGEIQVDSVEL